MAFKRNRIFIYGTYHNMLCSNPLNTILFMVICGGNIQELVNSITDSEDFHKLLIHYATFFGWNDAIVLLQFQRVDCIYNQSGTSHY